MRLSSIWSMRGYSFTERLRRTRDAIFWKLPDLLPLRLRYMTTLREIGKATRNSPNISSMSLSDILQELDAPKNLA